MPRKPRLNVPDGLYHVILRGNARQDIFADDEDRHVFYGLLEQGTGRFGYRVHAFCLMSNHVHFALQAGVQPLARGMHNLAFRYARHVNQRQQRVGHVFQGRYKALLVEADRYALELVRYIHLNPVRAHIVKRPESYPHSGHLSYLGKTAKPFLTTEWVLGQFADRLGLARERYAKFVAQGIGEGHRADFHRGQEDSRVIGGHDFAVESTVEAREIGPVRGVDLESIIAYVCVGFGLDEMQLARPGKDPVAVQARALIGWLALQAQSNNLSAVAHRFNRNLSNLSRGVRRLEQVMAEGGKQAKGLLAHLQAVARA